MSGWGAGSPESAASPLRVRTDVGLSPYAGPQPHLKPLRPARAAPIESSALPCALHTLSHVMYILVNPHGWSLGAQNTIDAAIAGLAFFLFG